VNATQGRSCGAVTANAPTGEPPTAGSAPSASVPGSAPCTPNRLRAAFIMAALDAGVPLRDVQTAARHADPRTTTIHDRRRQNVDRHAPYVAIAFVAGG
jgi:integrase